VVRELAQYPFVIFPVEPLDESNAGSATLGLPEDLLRAIATSHTPVLVVGSPETCAGRLVRHFGVGEVAGYDAAQISASIDRMRTPDAQQRMRQAAARIAAVLSDRDIPEWLAQSIRLGGPADPRFEELFAGYYTAHDQYHSGSTAL
jgi:hypothetical protein